MNPEDSIWKTTIKSGFERHVQISRGVLRVRDDLYQLDSYSRVLVIAFGRSAHIMATELAEQLGPLAAGIISTPQIEGQSQLPGFRYFHGGHPLPNAESVRAAEAIVKTLSSLSANAFVIYLISAGSSLVESSIDKEISLDDLAVTYQVLDESESTPDDARAILKHLSAVKGGRMALNAGKAGAQQVSIFVSDVPNDSPASLACGPTMPDSSTVEDCYRIASQFKLTERFPVSVRELFERRALDETPDKDHPAFHNCRWWPIIDLKEKR